MDTGEGDELVLVAHRRQLVLELRDRGVVEVLLPVERRRAVVGQQLVRIGGQHGLRELAGKTEVRGAGLAPHQIRVRCIGHAAADRLFEAVFHTVETLRGTLAGEERLVVGVDVIGQQVGRLRIGACQQQCGHTHHVGCEARRNQLLDRLAGRHQHLAAHVAALLHRRELIFEVHPGSTVGDHVLHQFEGVEHATEAGLGIGHDRQEVIEITLVARADPA